MTCIAENCDRDARARGFCGSHYKQFQKTGTTRPLQMYHFNNLCSVEGCTNRGQAKGMCTTHYGQVRKWGAIRPYTPHQPGKLCSVSGCFQPHRCKSYCSKHYQAWRRYGDPLIAKIILGFGSIRTDGYRSIAINGTRILEHRHIMQLELGRQLLPGEEVHHINGDKLDNRLENLELWSTHQPKGQRVADKVAWAEEILSLYRPNTDVPFWAVSP